MQQQLTIISCICGLIIIFIAAAIKPNQYGWVVGISALLLIVFIRIILVEVALKTEISLMIISLIWIIVTLLFLF